MEDRDTLLRKQVKNLIVPLWMGSIVRTSSVGRTSSGEVHQSASLPENCGFREFPSQPGFGIPLLLDKGRGKSSPCGQVLLLFGIGSVP
jgi:hypothetical protein